MMLYILLKSLPGPVHSNWQNVLNQMGRDLKEDPLTEPQVSIDPKITNEAFIEWERGVLISFPCVTPVWGRNKYSSMFHLVQVYTSVK